MGFFTWRAAKGAKRETQRLRSDLKRQQSSRAQRWQERIDRIEEGIKTLPQEGKDEINALRAAEAAKSNRRKLAEETLTWVSDGHLRSADSFYKEQEKIIATYKARKMYEPVE